MFEAKAEAYPAELAEELRGGTYRPEAVKRVEIPKGDGQTRPLGVPTVKDRIVQAAVKLVIEPIFEFHNWRPATGSVRGEGARMRCGKWTGCSRRVTPMWWMPT
jgi:RNA-directed DNA polymerase